jgi:hypothetical protein
LLERVGAEADRIELIHLPGQDRSLDVFHDTLLQEGRS